MSKKQFYNDIIYKWVKENFGESEADNPSWSIEALAEELDKHAYELFHKIEKENVEEDVVWVAKEYLDTELTDEELEIVTENYMNSDGYGSLSDKVEDIKWFINKAKERNN